LGLKNLVYTGFRFIQVSLQQYFVVVPGLLKYAKSCRHDRKKSLKFSPEI